MYEAIIRVNDSRQCPIKLELYFCRDLAKHLDWHHRQQVIIRFEGTRDRWAGTIGMKATDPYVWSNVTLVGAMGLVAGRDSRPPVSELLHLHKLKATDRVPVHIDQNGDVVLGVKQHGTRLRAKSDSRPQRTGEPISTSLTRSSSSKCGSADKAFPFGSRKEIEKLADDYWEKINRSEWHVEQHEIPKIVQDARKRGYLDKEEFVTLARWKSTRPTPSYLNNSRNVIESRTKSALVPTANREDALAALDELDGVALRTATAILHWFRPDDTPILDQRVVAAIDLVVRNGWETNIDFYHDVADKIIREARRVSVDLRTMDRALWTWDKNNPR